MSLCIAVDAMGGDRAPHEVVRGAVEAARDMGFRLALVGDEREIKRLLPSPLPKRKVEIVHAPQVVGMGERPLEALRKKPLSSVALTINLLKEGRAQAAFSAGNTGATFACASLSLGTLEGVERPAIGTILPSARGRFVLIDAGANVDCKPEHLLGFAILGSVYAQVVLRKRNPKVALLSIGEEPEKGDKLTRKAHALLKNSPLNFVGNVEGDALFRGKVDVAVCDGFVGNVVLKVGEGFAEFFTATLRKLLYPEGRFPSQWAEFERRMDYAEYGGALLLGVPEVVVIGHGRSNAKAVYNALRVAKRAVEGRLIERLRSLLGGKAEN